MDKPPGIELTEAVAHGADDAAAEGFVAAGPDQHAGVVLIPLIDALHPVQQQRQKLPMLLGDGIVRPCLPAEKGLPAAMGLHVGLVHNIEAVTIAQLIQRRLVGIMRSADRVDVVPLHGDDVPLQLLPVRHAAGRGTEIVAIDALEDDALPVQAHEPVLQLKAPEAHPLADDLGRRAVGVHHMQGQLIEVRRLCAPQGGRMNGQRRRGFLPLGKGNLSLHEYLPPAAEGQAQAAGTLRPCGNGDESLGEVLADRRNDGEIGHTARRLHREIHAAEDAGETEHILILKPTAGCPFPHTHGQGVLPLVQRLGQIKVRGIEAALAVADIPAVEPEGKTALHPLEADINLPSAEMLRQGEGGHIVRHGVKDRGHLARRQFLQRVPRILDIDIGRSIPALQLDMCRNGNAVPIGAVIVRQPEALRRGRGPVCIVKTPAPVEAYAQAALPRGELFVGRVGDEVRMGRQPPLGEDGGIQDGGFIDKFFHAVLLKKRISPDYTLPGVACKGKISEGLAQWMPGRYNGENDNTNWLLYKGGSTMFDQLHDGSLYLPLADEIVEVQRKCLELQYDYNATRPSETERREALLREMFAAIGEGSFIEPPLHANWGGHFVRMGKNVYANFGLTLVDDTTITIGDNCMFGPNVVIATAGHPILPQLRAQGYQYNAPVTIGRNVWVGAGALILPGVCIGDDTVIGAGSVVTHDIPSGVVAVGNPCRVLRPVGVKDRAFYFRDKRVPLSLLSDD